MIRRRAVLVVGLILLGFSASARLYRLEADPPHQIVPGYTGHTHFRDEPAKAHEARNKAVFGKWKLNDADEYGFWRRQSPVWVYGQYLWFKLFGVSYASARLYVVMYGVAGIMLLFGLVAAWYGVLAATFATVLLSFNFAYLQYTRMALMEAVVIFYLLASTCALAATWRDPRRARILVPVSGLLFLASSLTKQSGLVFAPLVAGMAVYVVYARSTRGDSVGGRIRQFVGSGEGKAVLGTACVLFILLGALLVDPVYSERLSFQVREHFIQPPETSLLDAVQAAILDSLTGTKIHDMLRYLAPVGFGLATAEVVRVLVTVASNRRRRVAHRAGGAGADGGGEAPRQNALGLSAPPDVLSVHMIGWLGLALGVNLATREHLVHFQLIMFPPIALLGGLFAARLWHAAGRARGAMGGGRDAPTERAVIRDWCFRGTVILAGVAFAMYHGERYYDWAKAATFTFPESSRALRQIIGERDAVVVGEFAAQVTFETRYKHYYIRPKLFNASGDTLVALGITHLVAHEDDLVTEVMRRNAPHLLQRLKTIGQIEFYGLPLNVYELDDGRSSNGR